MTDIDRAFRDAGQMPVKDLWPDIVTRTPGEPPSRSPSPRAKAVVVAVVVAALGIGFFLRAFSEGSTRPATRPTNSNRHYGPGLSPDGTMFAYWRDPENQHRRDMGMNPYVLQVWLSNADGSGERKIWQEPGCCIAIFPELHWSKDGSSIVIILGDRKHRIDVAAGGSLPMPSSTGSSAGA